LIAIILPENNLPRKLPDDLVALIKMDISIVNSIEGHKKDGPSLRGLILTESKIGRLAKYYKRAGKLPTDWKFDRAKAKLLIE
ncbi:MAG: 30S ribosomal protein S15, partial [Nanoarchaeota archaeon]